MAAGQRGPEGRSPRRQPSREGTEAKLEEAALALLRRDGVLAGLNLREVADTAGVNRGLVYHYYGSRGKLLRRALRRRGQPNLERLRAADELPARERWRRFFEIVCAAPEPVELATLLLLDHTEHIRAMPRRDETRRCIERDVADGLVDPELDLVALHTVLVTAVYGYVLYREAFAKELGVPLPELDERVAELLYGRVFDAFAPRALPVASAPERSPVRERRRLRRRRDLVRPREHEEGR
jgi:AcrR family transcriptional regulator